MLPSRCALIVALSCSLATPARAELPADGVVIWASNREDGRHEIYRMNADGSAVTRLTFGGGAFPSWSPDGHWIAYHRPVEDTTHLMRRDGGDDRVLCQGKPMFWMHDRSGVVCGHAQRYVLTDLAGGSRELFRKSDFAQLGDAGFTPGGITHDGRWLVAWTDLFRDGYEADNGGHKKQNAAVVLDLQDRSKLYFFGSGCEPTTPPAGDLIYHVCADCPGADSPDFYAMNIADVQSRASYREEMGFPEADWGHEYFPRVSNDNQWIVYGASSHCHDHDTCDYEIFVHRIGSGSRARTRITTDPGNDQWPHLFIGPPEALPADGGAPDAPGPMADAAPVDRGFLPHRDGGNGAPAEGSCGCEVHGPQTLSLVLLLLALVAALRAAKRRQPRRPQSRMR